jgi:hypothetical protein
MSGGRFGYIQSRLDWEVVERLEELIEQNGKEKGEDFKNNWDREYFAEFSPETLEEFRKGLELVKLARVYIQRIDWLVSGDDSEESFHKRLEEDLAGLVDPFEPRAAIESFGFTEVGPGLFEKSESRDPWITYWIELRVDDYAGSPYLRIGQDVMTHEDVLFAGKVKSLTELETVFRLVGIETRLGT